MVWGGVEGEGGGVCGENGGDGGNGGNGGNGGSDGGDGGDGGNGGGGRGATLHVPQVTGQAALTPAPCVVSVQYPASWAHVAGLPLML